MLLSVSRHMSARISVPGLCNRTPIVGPAPGRSALRIPSPVQMAARPPRRLRPSPLQTPKPGVRDRSRPGSWVCVSGGGREQSDARPGVTKIVTGLLYFDSRTGIFKLFFNLCCLLLVDTLLDRLGRGLD